MRAATVRVALAGVAVGALVAGAAAAWSQVARTGIPSSPGVDHIGLGVPNLEEAIRFFENVLGCEHIYTAGPFNDAKGDWMKTNLGVDRGASTTLAMVRCGPSQNIELLEYQAKDQVRSAPKNSDVGAMHVAFYVEDMAKAFAYLQASPGVTILGKPTPVSNQPNGGETFAYFVAPWGTSMEIVSYNKGMDYEKSTGRRLYKVKE